MEKLSYIASFIATVLSLLEPFNKKMKTVLIFSFLGNVLVGTSYVLVGGFSGAAICFVAAVQVLINYTFAAREKKISRSWVIVHSVFFLAVNLITFKAWYDVFSLIAAMLFVLSVAQSNPKYYRAIFIPNCIVWILYDFMATAYGNLLTHIVVLFSLLIAVAVRDKKKGKELR